MHTLYIATGFCNPQRRKFLRDVISFPTPKALVCSSFKFRYWCRPTTANARHCSIVTNADSIL
ncbi:hypothetical protein PISMIDRAFT_684875, partial [Pisolithus microcarpus 441]